MSFVTTQPGALAAAARNLQVIDAAMTAQNAAAATPTTGVVPAAADEVSALQATQFAAYGKLYQQVSAQAAAIQELFVQTLRTSADSYDATETANAIANGTSNPPLNLISLLTGAASGPYGLPPTALSNGGIAGVMQVSNFGSAASDLLQLGSAGFLAPGTLQNAAAVSGGAASAVLTNSTEPAAAAAASSGTSPALVSAEQAESASSAVPPSWAGSAAAATGTPPAPIATAGGPSAAPHTPPTNAVPAGIPAASTERGSFGRLRYGIKPKVMPRRKGV